MKTEMIEYFLIIALICALLEVTIRLQIMKCELHRHQTVTTVARQIWAVDRYTRDSGETALLGTLSEMFPEDVHTVETCTAPECMDGECDECPRQADVDRLIKKSHQICEDNLVAR